MSSVPCGECRREEERWQRLSSRWSLGAQRSIFHGSPVQNRRRWAMPMARQRRPLPTDQGNGSVVDTVQVFTDPATSLTSDLAHYFRVIDPCPFNKQGNDGGRQYRTGKIIQTRLRLQRDRPRLRKKRSNWATKSRLSWNPESHYILAEGSPSRLPQEELEAIVDVTDEQPLIQLYPEARSRNLKAKLTAEQYQVTKKARRERPFPQCL